MKAFTIKKYGKKEELQLIDVAPPTLKDNEVMVKIHAAGLNLLDAKR